MTSDGPWGTRSALAAANRAVGFVTREGIDIELGTDDTTLKYLEKAQATAAKVVLRAHSMGLAHLRIELEKLIPDCLRANLKKWLSIMTAEQSSTTIDQSKWTDDLILFGLAHLTEVRFACAVVTHTEVLPAELLPIGASWLRSPEAKDSQSSIILWASKPNTGQDMEVVLQRTGAGVLPAWCILDLSDKRAREAQVTRAVSMMIQAQQDPEEQEHQDIQQAIRENSEHLDKYRQEDDMYRWHITTVMAESAEQHNRERRDDGQLQQSLSTTFDQSMTWLKDEQIQDEVIMRKSAEEKWHTSSAKNHSRKPVPTI